MDGVPETPQETKPLPHSMSPENHKMQDKIPDTEVLNRAKMHSIDNMLRSGQLRWAGHFRRMDDTRIPKQLLYGEVVNAPGVVMQKNGIKIL